MLKEDFWHIVAHQGDEDETEIRAGRIGRKTCERRLSGDTERQATSGEVSGLKREMRDLKEVVADLTLENRILKKA